LGYLKKIVAILFLTLLSASQYSRVYLYLQCKAEVALGFSVRNCDCENIVNDDITAQTGNPQPAAKLVKFHTDDFVADEYAPPALSLTIINHSTRYLCFIPQAITASLLRPPAIS
jgi:hypothetical protein